MFLKTIRQVTEDFHSNELLSGSCFIRIPRLFFSQKAWAILLIRIVVNETPLLGILARILLNSLFHIEIGGNVKIGNRLFIPHPTDIVIARNTVIGERCSLYHRITFAEKKGIHKGPVLGNKCVVGTGTVLVGNIHIGDNVSIGPNSVLINDVEDNMIVFGNPAQIKPKRINQSLTE